MNRAQKAWIQGEKIKLQPERKKQKKKIKIGWEQHECWETAWTNLTNVTLLYVAQISINIRCTFDKGWRPTLWGNNGNVQNAWVIFSLKLDPFISNAIPTSSCHPFNLIPIFLQTSSTLLPISYVLRYTVEYFKLFIMLRAGGWCNLRKTIPQISHFEHCRTQRNYQFIVYEKLKACISFWCRKCEKSSEKKYNHLRGCSTRKRVYVTANLQSIPQPHQPNEKRISEERSIMRRAREEAVIETKESKHESSATRIAGHEEKETKAEIPWTDGRV